MGGKSEMKNKIQKANDINMDVLFEIDLKEQIQKFIHKTLEERVAESGIPLVANEEYDFGEPVGGEYW